jgi:4,5-dihydroxyphthalate decarboxylase
VAIRAFVSGHFRHSAIYVRTDRNLRGPADLKGKLVGLLEYQQTANVWMRGIFKEECGVDPSDIHWRTAARRTPVAAAATRRQYRSATDPGVQDPE